MKRYHVSYSYDIKDRVTDDIVFWKRNGFDLELQKDEDIDGSLLRARIKQMAQEKADTFPHAYVSHANYYHIEELSGGKKRKKSKS